MKRQISQPLRQFVTNGGYVRNRYALHDDHLLLSYDHPRVNGVYQSGGPFYVKKRHYDAFICDVMPWKWGGLNRTIQPWIGWLNTSPISTGFEHKLDELSDHQASAMGFGATGWARARPGNPVAGISTFVGELRDLPRLPLRLFQRLKHFRALGGEYLNVVFGWMPFVSELKKMYELYRRLDKHLAQLIRNNGRGIKRERTIRDDHSVTSSKSEYGYPFQGWNNPPPSWFSAYSSVETQTETIDKIWFEGRFRYYIEDIGSSEWTRRATRALFGVNVTPEVVWDLLPWSWLIDWFGNIGDVMSNMSSNAVDNLTADYAYVMRTVETRVTKRGVCRWTQKGPSRYYDVPAGNVSGEAVNSTVTKMRFAASPYGFGVSYGGLSPYQAGVIAALGISRW